MADSKKKRKVDPAAEQTALIFNSTLNIKGNAYKVVEAELYCEEDPYTHGNAQQLEFETFYFHKMNKGFKEGTYKGMDVTFGDGKKHCGYLIRAIKEVKTGVITEGPCLVVNVILNAFKHVKVREFHEEYIKTNPTCSFRKPKSGLSFTITKNDDDDDDAKSKSKSKSKDDVQQEKSVELHASPRVGLKYKKFESHTPKKGALKKEGGNRKYRDEDIDAKTVLSWCMGSYRFIRRDCTSKIKKQSSTIKMTQNTTTYETEREVGSKTSPSKLLSSLGGWKVADIAKCYGCFTQHCQ